MAIILIFFASSAESDLEPVAGLNAFGGAERGNSQGITSPAGAIGGTEVFGLYPFTKTFGIQGGLLNQGGRGGYRLGISAGPVFDYGAGKVGLFADYVYQNQGSNNYIYIRPQWSHYFQNWDLVVSYSQPVNSVQHTFGEVRQTIFDDCGIGRPPGTPFDTRITKIKKSAPAINELKAFGRIYPTNRTEITLGLLVNSFAGPDRNETGTGFGGIFGASIQLLDWMILRPIQGQMDTRERYRITSGVEFIWTPAKEQKRERLLGTEKETSFELASSSFTSIGGDLSQG